jgi:protein involved in sex pheromone biosynthesis
VVLDPRGRRLRPLFKGKETEWRETLGIESKLSRGVLHKNELKYTRYDAAGFEERLMDLPKDPYETKHFTNDSHYTKQLGRL